MQNSELGDVFTLYFLLLTSYFLLLTSYFLLLTSYFLLLTSYFLLLTSYFLLLTSYFLLLTSYFLLLTSYFLLLTSYFFLLTSYFFLNFVLISFIFFKISNFISVEVESVNDIHESDRIKIFLLDHYSCRFASQNFSISLLVII